MSDIINLNKKRKAKARDAKEQQASENRIKFGRTKQEKQLEKAKEKLADKQFDGHKREKDD